MVDGRWRVGQGDSQSGRNSGRVGSGLNDLQGELPGSADFRTVKLE